MKTTINDIYSYNPCYEGFKKICEYVYSSEIEPKKRNIAHIKALLSDEELKRDVSILEVLNNNGVQDTFWVLRTQNYKDYCLILADIAESVLHLYEKRYPKNKTVRSCIEGVRQYYKNEITKDELKKWCNAAYNAAYNAAAAENGRKQWAINEKILRSFLTKEEN